MVETFTVDTERTAEQLGWTPDHEVAATIEAQIDARLRE
jgi:GDP-D-mannose dehydratase